MDRDVLAIIAVVAVVGVLCVYVGPVIYTWTFVGQRYEVVIVIQATEKSTRFGEHTNVWVVQYGGEEPLMYKLVGWHDLDVGKTYRIVFVNQFAVYGYTVWGGVELIEVVK